MPALRRLDAFAKTRPEMKKTSAAGGLITMIAAGTAVLLFFAQILQFLYGDATHSLHLARSQSFPLLTLHDAINPRSHAGRMALELYITFPHLACNQLDVTLDGASLLTGEMHRVHGAHTLKLRDTTRADRFHSGDAFRIEKTQCTLKGKVWPPQVAGVFTIGVSRDAWMRAVRQVQFAAGSTGEDMHQHMQPFNVSHYIHTVRFGEGSSVGPLDYRKHWIENEYGGIAVEHLQVKLVPTYKPSALGEYMEYQMSVSEHTIQPATLIAKGVQYMPGMVMNYDFTPLLVRQLSGRDSMLVFLSSLISIVGGVFVTVGLVTGCLVYSAKEVAKKID